mmetsp:Transcript_46683/g.109796  ORF Transcript_46683/g.109796 Transcript_46683/m.109796 type:complete len:119 (-) Transcript_46683:37-393(-)
MDSVCFHPKPEPAPKLPPIPVKPAPNPIRAMFPDSYAPATPDSHPKEAADLLPPAQQNLQGEYGGRFDRVVPAEEPPVVADPQIPDLSAPKIGPQDNILNVKFEKEDGPLPGQDQVAE